MDAVLTAAGLGDRTPRIGDEVDRCLRILSALRAMVEADVDEVLKSKSPGIPKGTLTQLKEITSCMNSLCDAKVRLDKNAKMMADSMSPEDEEKAVRSWIRSLEPKKRRVFLEGEVAWTALNT